MKMKFDFIGRSKTFFIISIAIMAIIIVATLLFGVNLDIQFKGGLIVTYAYEGEIDTSEFEQRIRDELGAGVSVQESSDIATGFATLVMTMPGSLESQELNALNDTLEQAYPENNLKDLSISNVDPTIGGEFLAKCITAVAVASILMMVYVALRFRKIGGISAGAMAVVALIHDIIVVYGVFVILGYSINDNFIAVVLTILGYSLNDTIVIYDRVRENRRLMSDKTPIGELVNQSINQSFTRTLFTSITTIMAMLVVTLVAWMYNVNSIMSFALPMVIGLISGTYSSICIAGPLWVKWREYSGAKANLST